MTRREQIRANRKSLARLHVLEFHQLIMRNINSVEKKEDDDQEGADLGQREVLARLNVLECHQLIMHKINSGEKKEDSDQEGADPSQPEVLGSPARVGM